MMKWLQNYSAKKGHQKALKAFAEETATNLESYYVMFQINRLRFFPLSAWERVKQAPWDASVEKYILRLTAYNSTLQEYQDFERWYNEDLDHKNQSNGRTLHAKKEAAEEKFKGLEDVIKTAVMAIGKVC